ncbi:MAG: Tetratricopeptide repeat protein [Acidobacteria bacterium]|nr:Tetratricopeptide repeat protein [Acidobacteriota bacterium]
MRKSAAFMLLLFLSCTPSVLSQELKKVIVFPLEIPSQAQKLEWMSEGIALSISGQLEGRAVKAVDRNDRIGVVEKMDLPPGAQLSRASMIRAAQQSNVDLLIMGVIAGTESSLKILVRALDIQSMKLSGDMVANGPLSALQQMENELAWMILNNTGLKSDVSRDSFASRTRKAPNSAYSLFIQSLSTASEKEQLRLLSKAVAEYRDFPQAQFLIGSLYYRRGECDKALQHLMLGRGEGGQMEENEFMCGTCYLQRNLPDPAIQTLSSLPSASSSYEVLNNLGTAYLLKGDDEAAHRCLEEALKIAHADSTVSLNYAIVRHLQGKDAEARRVLEEASKAHPKSGMIHFLLSILLKEAGEVERAAPAAERARNLGINVEKLQSDNPRSWSRVITSWK